MNTKQIIWIVAALAVLGLLIIGYRSTIRPKPVEPTPAPEAKSAVDATEKVSESVPEIVTNPAQKVPEVNPLDRANPYKYINPLR